MNPIQRQHNRIITRWRARVLKKGMPVVRGIIDNASMGGLFVRISQRFSLHDFILLEFETSDEKPPRRIVCECELLRCTQLDASEFSYGMRFHRIKDEDIAYLLELIARRWIAASPPSQNAPETTNLS